MLAAACVLLCAACGGPWADDRLRAALQADSAFAAPFTIRIPSRIHVSASTADSGIDGLGDKVRFGPEEFRRLHAPMDVLRVAGVLRVTDQSQRVLVHRSHAGFGTCMSARYSVAPAQQNCSRPSEIRNYDYAHTVRVTPVVALGAEWRQDAEPWEITFGFAGEASPGWVVELGRREIVDVTEVRKPEPWMMEVDYTWRWKLTPTGSHFDPDGGATLRRLPPSQRTFLIEGMENGLHADSIYTGTAKLTRIGGSWKIVGVYWQ